MKVNHKFRKIISISALSLFGMLATSKASAQESKIGYTTDKHCKFINGKTEIVMDHADTLLVHKIYTPTIDEYGNKRLKCDVSNKGSKILYELDFDPEYYKTTPWLPPIYRGDTIAFDMLFKDNDLVDKYYEFDNNGDYDSRDSIEQRLLANRHQLIEHSIKRMNQR